MKHERCDMSCYEINTSRGTFRISKDLIKRLQERSVVFDRENNCSYHLSKEFSDPFYLGRTLKKILQSQKTLKEKHRLSHSVKYHSYTLKWPKTVVSIRMDRGTDDEDDRAQIVVCARHREIIAVGSKTWKVYTFKRNRISDQVFDKGEKFEVDLGFESD